MLKLSGHVQWEIELNQNTPFSNYLIFFCVFFLSLSDFGFLNDNFFQVLIGKFSVYHENFPINFDIMGNVYAVYKNLKTK